MELPIATGGPTGPREGTHWSLRSNIPTPRYLQYSVTHTGSYLRTSRVFSEPYFNLSIEHSYSSDASSV